MNSIASVEGEGALARSLTHSLRLFAVWFDLLIKGNVNIAEENDIGDDSRDTARDERVREHAVAAKEGYQRCEYHHRREEDEFLNDVSVCIVLVSCAWWLHWGVSLERGNVICYTVPYIRWDICHC